MIKVVVKRKNEDIIGFRIEGHAGYADRGNDIVCAAVSVLAVNCANSIEKFTDDFFTEREDEERGMVDFELSGEISQQSQLLLKSMLLGLRSIVRQYGEKYVQIIDC